MFCIQKYSTYYVFVLQGYSRYMGIDWKSNIDNIGPIVQIMA